MKIAEVLKLKQQLITCAKAKEWDKCESILHEISSNNEIFYLTTNHGYQTSPEYAVFDQDNHLVNDYVGCEDGIIRLNF